MGDVYVKFDPAGRMGNRMFQYAFGYLLAKAKGCELFHEELPNFNIPRKVKNPSLPVINTRSLGLQMVDIGSLVKTDSNVVVDSFVQRAEYYEGFEEELRQAFSIHNSPTLNEGKLVLHVRATDYLQIGCFLGTERYCNLIESAGYYYDDVIIISDNTDCDTVRDLMSYGCKLNTSGHVEQFTPTTDKRGMCDFFTLMYSENIAISQSSFAWWAAFLGDHKQIFAPVSDTGFWKHITDGDVITLHTYSKFKQVSI